MSQPKFAVIGHPIGHTMSPFIHQQLFAMRGLSFDYDVFDIPPQELEQWIPRLKEYTGFNITIPNKEAILPFLDEIDPTAAAFGSVNTVKVQNGRMKGFTTDGPGCILALERGGVVPRGNVLIAGTGGAARALAFALACYPGVEQITLASRAASLPKGQAIAQAAESFAHSTGHTARLLCVPYEELEGTFDLMLNATSVGMRPNVNGCPVSDDVIARCKAVFDAVYNPGETVLLQKARAMGIPVVHGIDMLVYQAAAAQMIWDESARFESEAVARLCRLAEEETQRRFQNR